MYNLDLIVLIIYPRSIQSDRPAISFTQGPYSLGELLVSFTLGPYSLGDLLVSFTLGPYSLGDLLVLRCLADGGRPVPQVSWWNGTRKVCCLNRSLYQCVLSVSTLLSSQVSFVPSSVDIF